MDTPDASIPAVGALQRRKTRVRVRGGDGRLKRATGARTAAGAHCFPAHACWTRPPCCTRRLPANVSVYTQNLCQGWRWRWRGGGLWCGPRFFPKLRATQPVHHPQLAALPPPAWLATCLHLITWVDPFASVLALTAGVAAGVAVRAAATAAARGTLASLLARLALFDLALASLRGLLSSRLRGTWAGSAGVSAVADGAAAVVRAAASARDALLAPTDPRTALAAGAVLVGVARTAHLFPWGRVALLGYVGAFAVGGAARRGGPLAVRAAQAARDAASASPPATAWRSASLRTKAAVIGIVLATAWRAAPWSARADALVVALLFIRAAALRPADTEALRARAAPVLASASKTASRLGGRATDLVTRVAARRPSVGEGGVPRMKMF